MGVFVTGRQVAIEIDMPGWWLANASVDMDFRRGLYYDSATANPRAATDFLSCTRASIGYAKNADGTLTQFASNALRIGNGTGLLVEDARQNVSLQSADFSTTWSPDNTTVTTNQSVGPDGTTTAEKLTEDLSNGVHAVYQNVVTANSIPYTYSVYAKNGTRQFLAVNVGDGGSADRYVAVFDLVNGTITDTGSVGTITATSSSIEALANGWYRCNATAIRSAGSNIVILLGLANSGTPSYDSFKQPTYAGGGSAFVYVWGAQIEQAAFASSYIPTTSAAATRAADAVSCTGSLNTVLTTLPQSAVMDIAYLSPVTTDARIIGQSSGATSLLYARSADTVISTYNGTAGELFITLGNSLTFSGGVKVGVAEAASARSIVGGGGTVNTDTASNTVMTSPYIGSLGGSAPYSYAYVRRLTVWNSKLADATLQALTAP